MFGVIKLMPFNLRRKTKCNTVITKQECMKLLLKRMQWNIKKRFIETNYFNIYILINDVA